MFVKVMHIVQINELKQKEMCILTNGILADIVRKCTFLRIAERLLFRYTRRFINHF